MKAAKALTVLLPLLVLSCTGSAPAPPEVRFAAVGDVMLGRYIAKVMKSRGAGFPFERVRAGLRGYDIVLGNLEAGIAEDASEPFFPDKPYNFHASSAAAPALREAGFTVLCLANNHALDFGPDELRLTGASLDRQGISRFGAGKDITEARKPCVIAVKGLKVGFLGYGTAHSPKVYARKSAPGIAPIEAGSVEHDIRALRESVDILVVSYHWGMEYEQQPTRSQRELAHRTIDWGADLVIGHHPHVMQGIELYKGKPIAYSLGNFVFDQKNMGTDDSFMLTATYDGGSLKSLGVVPVVRAHVPAFAEGAAKERILGELRRLSAPLNANGALETIVR